MPNVIFGAIGRFWLEVNAHAWRYCPEAVQQRLDAAYETLADDARELLVHQSDADFGRGWREGHEAGRLEGWAQRDLEAQRELARKNDQIQALMTLVESYRMRLPAEPATAASLSAEPASPESARPTGLTGPRLPVH